MSRRRSASAGPPPALEGFIFSIVSVPEGKGKPEIAA